METIIAQLFGARDTAHRLHLRTRSFAAHIALGDLYDQLLEGADTIAELIQGKYGIMTIPNPIFTFTDLDAVAFIKELATWAENSKTVFNPTDTHLLNEWDGVIANIFRAKYKLENLS
jgi:hypothetical protein